MDVIFSTLLLLIATSSLASAQNKRVYTDQQANEQIDSLYVALQNGADFEEIARRYSQDIGSAEKGGELGWAKPGTFVEAYEKATRSLQINQITKPFQTEFEYHIVQLISKDGDLLRTRHILIRASI